MTTQPRHNEPYFAPHDASARSDDSRWHRIGLPLTTSSAEVTSLSIPGDGSLLAFGTLSAALVTNYGTASLTLLGRTEARYAADPTGSTPADPVPLALGTIESLALPYETYTLAVPHAQRVSVYGDLLDGQSPTTLGEALGYEVREDVEDAFDWWTRSGQVVVDPVSFYQPIESISRFGAHASITWDDDTLLVTSATDALGNVVTFANDYRLLVPTQLTDPNGNRTALRLDTLGRVVATAVMGKEEDDEGDSLDHPGARFAYSLSGPSAEPATPAWARSSVREAHAHDVAWDDEEAPRVLESVTYSDGFGRVISAKARVEPDPDDLSPMHTERWVASGRVVYDNKGNPVRQYEPYFAPDDAFEPDAEARTFGVSPTLFYDPLGRVVEVQHPDETRTVTTFGPWLQITWDRNDTASESGLYPARRTNAYGTTWPEEPPDPVPALWLDDRLDLEPEADEDAPTWDGLIDVDPDDEDDDVNAEETALQNPDRRAAVGMNLFDDTPTIVHLDVLGRVFATDRWNALPDGSGRSEEVYREFAELDVLGRPVSLRDARGNTAFTYAHDMAGRLLVQVGVDDGERRVLPDGSGKPAFVWKGAPVDGDAPYRTRHEYDVAERPTRVWLSVEGAAETLRSYVVYGEDTPGDPEDLNLRTRVWRTFDTAGLVESVGHDFKGNPLGSTRRLVVSNEADPNWSAVAAATTLEDADDEADLLLESTVYSSSASFDALNRPVATTSADGSVVSYTYDEGGALFGQSVAHRGAGSPQTVVDAIRYNARGQRVSAELGNGTTQTNTYDPLTFRLSRLCTSRTSDGVDLQDLRYTYDPEGNPTEIRDKARQRTFFNNDVVYPSRRYAYDALYRLIQAEGRETAFAPASPWSAAPTPEQPIRTGSDPAAMRRYIEHFTLDANGNLLELEHAVPSNTSASWTRTMTYATGSNRLATYQGTGSASVEEPAHDELGRMVEMPGIDELEWDAEGRLRRTRVASAGAAETRYVYDGAGIRVRKARYTWITDAWVKTGETVYVGGIDIEREFVAGDVEEEIETLHLSDAGRRIALVETRTVHLGDAVTTPVGKWRFQHDDHLRSSCVETNIDGVVISYEEYHAYGTTAHSAHTSALEERPKRYRYSGKERDEESGLYYYGARYLAPWLGRWISPDPAGTVDGVNLYGFCRGNPVRLLDSEGAEGLDPNDSASGGSIGTAPTSGLARFLDSSPLIRGAFEFAERRSAELGAVDASDPVVLTEVTSTLTETRSVEINGRELQQVDTIERTLVYSQNGTLVAGSEDESSTLRPPPQYLVGDGTIRHGERGLRQYQFQQAVALRPVGTLSAIATIFGQEELVPLTNAVGEMAAIAPGAGAAVRGSRARAPIGARRSRPGVYDGVREASAHLRALGVSREVRQQVLQSFDVRTIQVQHAGPSQFGLRYFDNLKAFPRGRFLFETFPAGRESLALPPEWNKMTGFQQFQIRPGATYFRGETAPQGDYYSGGKVQMFVPNLGDLR